MHRIFRVKAYEMEHGPHFNEEHARKAVMKMENEDGTRGQHWSLEETSALASQYGISLSGKFNRYDWYVALNIVNQLKPIPVPAYLTYNPYGCNGGFGYSYGYNDNYGYGCGC